MQNDRRGNGGSTGGVGDLVMPIEILLSPIK
jgi:hypothetical protein